MNNAWKTMRMFDFFFLIFLKIQIWEFHFWMMNRETEMTFFIYGSGRVVSVPLNRYNALGEIG